MSKTFIMDILYSTIKLRIIGLQCKMDFSTFASSTLPKDICKRKRGKRWCKTKITEAWV